MVNVSVPLPGFSGLRLSTNREDLFGEIYSFSPVAGIQWVETEDGSRPPNKKRSFRFSPVAGIQWVETVFMMEIYTSRLTGFSPVAGIQWVETAVTAPTLN